MEDREIVDLYKRREESAIKETALKYGHKLNRISINIVGNFPDAEECENDTYLEAWKLIPPHEPNKYLFSFLAKIIRNLSLNFCKRKNTQKRSAIIIELTSELEQCIPAPDCLPCKLSDSELGKVISTFLRSEKEESRNVFLRRYWFADSIKDIALRFSISESKAKSMLFRTRNKLRQYLKKEGYDL